MKDYHIKPHLTKGSPAYPITALRLPRASWVSSIQSVLNKSSSGAKSPQTELGDGKTEAFGRLRRLLCRGGCSCSHRPEVLLWRSKDKVESPLASGSQIRKVTVDRLDHMTEGQP
ncbi:hypothetical protein I79_009239 [Cricetulus griseus]|uniref:Uncharacterized protein n=1 Tax=Cricetulus griseus TaxID=10029 RepID=G3HF83_CRIGR|nr:hypothetical protein I79_009239 [Cricetulus griseus]